MVSRKFELVFVKKEQLTKDTYMFYFERSKEEPDYLAGQYFRITIPIENPDDRGSSRFFTMSSSPLDELFEITTRIIQSSFKLKLNSLRIGEKITFFGPMGDLYFDENNKIPLIMIAGGIGITPAHSILKYLDQIKANNKVTLLVSFSKKTEVIFYDELKEIESKNSNVKIVYFLTKEENFYPGFEKGRISEEMIKKYVQDCINSRFFITGPPAMAKAMSNIVIGLGVSNEKIITENFTGY